MKEYFVIIPENLNLNRILLEYPPNFQFNTDFAFYVIGDVLKRTAYQLDEKDGIILREIFTSECSDILQSFNRNYRMHLRYLSENGRILFRKNYAPGQCYSYQLNEEFMKGEMKVIALQDKNLIKKIKQGTKKVVPNKLKKKYSFLINYLSPDKFTVLFEEAIEHIKSEYSKSKNFKNQLIDITKVINLKNEDIYFSYNPETDGRIHTNMTSFPKKLRKFLRYEGKKLAEIDISSSVPTFLFFLLSNINNNNIHLSNIIHNKASFFSHYMSVKKTIDADITEIERFGNLILSGAFYSEFVEGFHKAHYINPKLEADEYYLKNVKKICGRNFDGDEADLIEVVKKNILSMFNAKPNKFKVEEVFFWEKFPFINYFIMSMKKKNHKFFSYLMLQIESYFMINIVARELNKKYKRKIPVITLHDCIVTTEENMLPVYNFMKGNLKSNLGFEPKMKYKVFE